jgi:hypothetical protein
MKETVAVDGQEYHLLKCNFHTHYFESYGDRPEVMVDAHYEAGYHCVALTEHDIQISDLDGEKRAQAYAQQKYGSDFLVIVGEELAFNDSKVSGCMVREMLALFLDDFIVSGRKFVRDYDSLVETRAALDEVHRQGGIAIICHDNWLDWFLEYAGLGKYPWMWGFREGLPIDGWEVANGVGGLVNSEQAGRDLTLSHPHETVAEGYIPLADSDAHKAEDIPLCQDTCFTYVFAHERTVAGVKEALLNRRVVAVNRGEVYGPEKLVEALRKIG